MTMLVVLSPQAEADIRAIDILDGQLVAVLSVSSAVRGRGPRLRQG